MAAIVNWRKVAVLFIVPSLGLISFAIAPSPASAGVANCPAGQVCMYKDTNYNGGRAAYVGNDPDYTNNTFDGCTFWCGLNDRTSSAHNNGNFMNTRHYHDIWNGGDHLFVQRGGKITNVGDWHNDMFSSHKWV